jgi:hypothetical protein
MYMANKDEKLSFMQVLASVMASFIGVQSAENRQRDFEHGKAMHFVWVGVLMTGVFCVAIIVLVNVVLAV